VEYVLYRKGPTTGNSTFMYPLKKKDLEEKISINDYTKNIHQNLIFYVYKYHVLLKLYQS
jgi:hypothetical protein